MCNTICSRCFTKVKVLRLGNTALELYDLQPTSTFHVMQAMVSPDVLQQYNQYYQLLNLQHLLSYCLLLCCLADAIYINFLLHQYPPTRYLVCIN